MKAADALFLRHYHPPNRIKSMAFISNPFLLTHVITAMLSLLIGGILFLRPKGTGHHRQLGISYFVLMLVTNISVIFVTARVAPFGKTGFGVFHIFAAISLASLIRGGIALVRWHRSRNAAELQSHQINLAFSYLGLVMAFASETLVNRDLGMTWVSSWAEFWAAMAVINIVIYAGGAWLILSRLAKGDPMRFAPINRAKA